MKESTRKRILIIEDEAHIAEGLKLNLTLLGYESVIAGNGQLGLQLWKEWNPHLVILDIMLPGIDGLVVLRRIRLEDERLPVLILSAKSDADDKIKGFSCGVDDYLAKPFNLDEFLMRVERLLKRAAWNSGDDVKGEMADDEYFFGNNSINFSTMTAVGRRGTIRLTDQEAKLLRVLIVNKGKPVSRKDLLEVGWGYSGETTTRTVDNFIVRLRKYFEENPNKPVYFKSLRSIGYIFDDASGPTS